MRRLLITALTLAASMWSATAFAAPDPGQPHLRRQGTATQLIVDGKPFLALAGELHNSSGSDLAHLEPIWPMLAKMNLNTVLAPVYWELSEPKEGVFDFHLVDGMIEAARRHKLRLVLLWFGTWKNGQSSYVPAWVKTDGKRFERAVYVDGVTAPETISPFSAAARDADARAFAALMRHLRQVDGSQHTVVMVQVENEVGLWWDTRDRSAAANRAFAGPVPKELMDYITRNRNALIPEFAEVWRANGSRTSGTWEQVFGKGRPAAALGDTPAGPSNILRKEYWPADEAFMSWNYARYVNAVVRAGKAEYDLPMFVNGWLQQPAETWPGTIQSGRPTAPVMDVWRAGAPQIDFYGVDLYLGAFDAAARKFHRSGNPLAIPETMGGEAGAANLFHAVGQHDALLFSPFGADTPMQAGLGAGDSGPLPADVGTLPLALSYDVMGQLAPLILDKQGKGQIGGVLVRRPSSQPDSPMASIALGGGTDKAQLSLGGYTIDVVPPRYFGAGFGSAAPGSAAPAVPRSGAIFIASAPDEFIVASNGTLPLEVAFGPANGGTQRVGILSADEGRLENGKWVQGRRLNGDDTTQGQTLRLQPLRAGNRYPIVRVKVYRY